MLHRLRLGPRLYYLLAHLPHMLLGVALVLMFSRLVTAEEFGQYAKGFAYINIAGAFLYGWLQISLLRLAEGKDNNAGPKLNTVLLALVLPIAPCFLLASIFCWLDLIAYPLAAASAAAAYSSSVCLSQYARGINNASLYGLLGFTRLLVVLGAAYILTQQIPNAASLLYALASGGIASTLIGAVFIALSSSNNLHLSETVQSRTTVTVKLNDLFRYGAPASISLVVVMLLIHGDRFIVGLLMSDAETAYYSAQADLARQMIYPIIVALSVSLVPQALKRNREQGSEIARKFIDKESTVTLNLILPILIMLLVFGNDIMKIILPPDYVDSSKNIAALAAMGAFLAGYRLVRFDPLFHLDFKPSRIGFSALTGLLCWAAGIMPLIIFYGTTGAACAGILGATGALVYAYSTAVINGVTNPILTKSTSALSLLLIGTAFSIQQFFFISSSEVTVLNLIMVLIILYTLNSLFSRWFIIHE